ncbi:MAG: electron transport complex subunit E [Gammaproteobacteria bacterium]|nr:MAG: electron transport complex subunit E [Gammaproteobacteria bacterium]
MSETPYRQIIVDGLWHNNTGLVQLLGLCPLLAVTSTVVNGLGLGLATVATLVASNTVVSLIRNHVRQEVRVPVFVLIIASIVTVIELIMHAWFHELYLILGIFIPLIVTNCAILGRAEAFAAKHDVGRAALDGLMIGLGFAAVLVVLGALRELIGSGTLLAHAQLLFGSIAEGWEFRPFEHYRGFLVAVLPPGAFFGLGLLIALKNIIDRRAERKAASLKARVGNAPATQAT